jgi:hypothetical protein
MTQAPGQAFTNVKTTSIETMEHHPVKTEIAFPASGRIEKS